jgi:hypothetical protein
MELIFNYKIKKMKTYNYFYDGTSITKAQFLAAVPENWESEVDEYGEYSYGYYRAIGN